MPGTCPWTAISCGRRGRRTEPVGKRSNTAGFTLLEVIVAIAVLGLVAAAVSGSLSAALRTNARAEARTQAELAVLRAAAHLRAEGYAPGDEYPEVEVLAAPDAAETADGTLRVVGYAVEVRSADPAWRDGTALTVYAPARAEGAP